MRNLLIDTDPGVDDALALLMAFDEPEARVLALTITAGNVGLDRTCENALQLVELLGVDVPVHPGCAVPLVQHAEDAAFVHGRDGFGDTGAPPGQRRPDPLHAALAMLRLSQTHAGDIDFVMLGPLTNLALALRLDPDLPQRVRRLVVMGGAVTGRGNVQRLPVEFNFGFDPEAAHIVCAAWPRLELVDWEATLAHALPFDRFAAVLSAGDRRAQWYSAISRKTREFMAATPHRGQWVAADALAMAVALAPMGVQAAEVRPLAIELTGNLTRGATVVDWDRRSGAPDRASIVRRYDLAAFEARIARALGVPGTPAPEAGRPGPA